MCQDGPPFLSPSSVVRGPSLFPLGVFYPKEEGGPKQQVGSTLGEVCVHAPATGKEFGRVERGGRQLERVCVCNVGVVGCVCVCVWANACVGGGAIANLCGRKLRLMVMKAMLLTNPHPELNTV